ncbi:MAG: hypothetical protein ACN4G0_16510 [Polyangiales bacterium]
MDRSKFYLVIVALVVVGLFAYKKLTSKSYAPIDFMGETYLHVEDNEVNKVANHMYTPGGVDIAETGEFIQISKYGHPDLTAQQVRRVQQQVTRSFSLQAVDGSRDRFFGIFEGTVPVYGYMKADAFLLKVGPKDPTANRESLRADSGARIDALSRVSSDL